MKGYFIYSNDASRFLDLKSEESNLKGVENTLPQLYRFLFTNKIG